MSRLRPAFPWFRLAPAGGGAGDTTHSDCTIGTAPLTDCAVTSLKIQDSTIATVDMLDCAITAAKIGDTAVITAKINNTAVTYAKIQDVTAVRLLGREDALAGSPQEIALSTELRFDTTNDWLEVSDSGILTGLIADSAVTTAKINNTAVTYAKIQDVTAQRLLAREDALAGSPQEVALSAELRFDTTNDWLEISDSGVLTGLVADSAITTAKINNAAVTASKHYDTTIVTRIVEVHATDTTLAVGDTVATFFVPAEFDSYDLVRAEAAVKIVSTTGTPTIQLRDVTGTGDMLTTKITIDSGEKTSFTAATASVIDTTNDTVLAGTEIAIDIDSAGTAAEDLYVILSFRKP